MSYRGEALPLRPYLAPPLQDEALSNLTSDLITESGGRVVPLLDALNRRVHGFHRQTARLEGAAQTRREADIHIAVS